MTVLGPIATALRADPRYRLTVLRRSVGGPVGGKTRGPNAASHHFFNASSSCRFIRRGARSGDATWPCCCLDATRHQQSDVVDRPDAQSKEALQRVIAELSHDLRQRSVSQYEYPEPVRLLRQPNPRVAVARGVVGLPGHGAGHGRVA
jgi:hypothetical protein